MHGRPPLPWTENNRFGITHLGLTKLRREAASHAALHAGLFCHARTLGGLLFDALFDAADAQSLEKLTGRDRPRPVIQLRTDDALLFALP